MGLLCLRVTLTLFTRCNECLYEYIKFVGSIPKSKGNLINLFTPHKLETREGAQN